MLLCLQKKQVTKDMILSAAFKLLKKQGYESVNIKKLSKELGCSTQPIYLSFSGMDELRNELVPLAVKEFESRIKKYGNGKIRLYDMSYIYFAENEPNLFCFLFMRANAFLEIKRLLLPIINRSIKEFETVYNISCNKADLLHDGLWMHTHGIASMIATKFCDWDLEKVSKMLESCKRSFTEKYEA